MNIKKVKISNNYAFQHVDRTYNQEGEYHGRSYIDPERSYLNFNLSKNNRHLEEQKEYIYSQIHPKRNLRKDATVAYSCIITLPEKLKKSCDENPELLREFFQDAYDAMTSFFDVTEDDVASAWVHLDETTPHMHLILTPLVREKDRVVCNFKKAVPHQAYMTFHPQVEKAMKEKGWLELDLQNGNKASLSVDQLKVQAIVKESALLDDEIQTRKNVIKQLDSEIEEKTNVKEKIENKTKYDTVLMRLFRREKDFILRLLKEHIHSLSPQSRNDLEFIIARDKVNEENKDATAKVKEFVSSTQGSVQQRR